MKNKKGFTLIELLAVIVILAIIALIAVPTIMNVLNKANKSAFKDTAYGIISAGELYFAEQQLELNGMGEDAEFTFPTDKIDIKGEVPAGTVLKVNKKGKIALAMSNGRYCVTKGYNDKDITITEGYTSCDIPEEAKTLTDLATDETGISKPSCITDKTGETKCAAGTEVAIKVNATDIYKFRVLNDENNIVTLIMSSNLPNLYVSWVSEYFYLDAGGQLWFKNLDNNIYGPLEALIALKESTSDWTNLEEYSYELSYGPVYVYDENGNKTEVEDTYSGEYVQNVRTRLPRLSDITTEEIGCTEYNEYLEQNLCPDWIYEGLQNTDGDNRPYAYWLSDASFKFPDHAWQVYYDGHLKDSNIIGDGVVGVRPVITLTK